VSKAPKQTVLITGHHFSSLTLDIEQAQYLKQELKECISSSYCTSGEADVQWTINIDDTPPKSHQAAKR